MEITFVRAIIVRTIELYIDQVEDSDYKGYTTRLKRLLAEVNTVMPDIKKVELESKLEIAIDQFLAKNISKIDGLTIGTLYETVNTMAMKKGLGQVYTPEKIVDYMIEETVKAENIAGGKRLKILDPSCGSGFFLVKLYRKLKSIISGMDSGLDTDIHSKFSRDQKISESIIESMIYGADSDFFSVAIAKISIIIESKVDLEPNITCQDILLEDHPVRFDLIIGNPPYIGAKNLKKDYKQKLKENYSDVYEDKSDISYCFFKRGHELLIDGGVLEIITSRYFLEALYAKKLRRYIKGNYGVKKMVDFYGENIFKGISISPIIISLEKGGLSETVKYLRPNRYGIKLKNMDIDKFDHIEVGIQSLTDDRWMVKKIEAIKLFEKIEQRGDLTLNEVANSNQGIITGLDRAFILTDIENIPEKERAILKRWIKNSDIDRYRSIDTDKYIIYTDEIDDVKKYPYLIKRMESFKLELQNRRECRLGIREWYEIQWSRDKRNFEGKRILFPYKSCSNRFAMATEELYHSADVYCIKIKDEFKGKLSTEYMVGFLNSSLFEFYFKMVAKKLNRSIYEYYPNKIMSLKMKLPNIDEEKHIVELVERISKAESKRDTLIEELDSAFLKLYNLNEYEKELISNEI